MGYSYQTADPMTYRLLKEFAAKQRAIPTEAESLLWNFLRASQMGVRYRHQHIIGEYIADCACVILDAHNIKMVKYKNLLFILTFTEFPN